MKPRSKKEVDKYFNFPVQLLSGLMADHNKALENILFYCLYNYTRDKGFSCEIEAFEKSAIHFGFTFNSYEKFESAMETGVELYNSLPDKSPRTGLSLDLFKAYYNIPVTEFEKLTLLGFLSLKSIVGQKPYSKTVNSLFFSRMDGHIKTVGFDELSPELSMYTFSKNKINYWSVKIRSELEGSWNVVIYGKSKGFYVSFKLNPAELIYQVEKIKLLFKNKERIRNSEKRELAKEALKKLHSELKL